MSLAQHCSYFLEGCWEGTLDAGTQQQVALNSFWAMNDLALVSTLVAVLGLYQQE